MKSLNQIIIATTNKGKFREISAALADFPGQLQLASSDMPEVAETGLTFLENALIKARETATFHQLPTLADDSGLCVPLLNHAPGLLSARFAGENATDQANINKLTTLLSPYQQTSIPAFFYCCLTLLNHPEDPMPIFCEAIWHGEIIFKPQGTNGFGYDPIFYLPEYQCTAAELDLSVKNQISHRGQALQQLKKKLCHYTLRK